MTTIRVLVVDDQRLVREGIASLLEIQDGISVIGTAVDGQQAVQQAEEMRPDVILMDVRMPVMDGVQATEHIQARVPACKVLMLTTFDDEEYIIKSLRAGAYGYLLKDTPVESLAQAIKLTHVRIYQLAPSVAGKLVGNWQKSVVEPAPEALEHDLTERELDVLRLLATGASNREIAEKLVVSEGTVKNHVSNILSRLGLRDRVQAALYAREHHFM
ncbi:MAG: response regulator transcription factor [Anaerolineae bacterium]|nr:response regulator transcription factor [Anaerolineae bacterium]